MKTIRLPFLNLYYYIFPILLLLYQSWVGPQIAIGYLKLKIFRILKNFFIFDCVSFVVGIKIRSLFYAVSVKFLINKAYLQLYLYCLSKYTFLINQIKT